MRFLNTTYNFFTSAKLCTLGFTNIIKYLCLGLKLVLKFAYHFDRVGKHFLFYLVFHLFIVLHREYSVLQNKFSEFFKGLFNITSFN